MVAGSVMGERMIRFSFNNGVVPTPGWDECTEEDNELIDTIFDYDYDQRFLRQLVDSDLEDGVDSDTNAHRELKPSKCKDNCIGIASGTCRATGCKGDRRRARKLSRNDTSVSGQNHRKAFTPCDTQIATMHSLLDELVEMNHVSEPCKRYLEKTKRKTECYDDVIYGEIYGANFYNMRYGVLGYNVQGGFRVCHNVPLNIEAVLNPCVHMVNFVLTGPNNFYYNRIDDNHPMLLFNTSTFASTYGGRYLQPGWYRVSATPDNFAHKQKSLDFEVIRCRW